MEVKECFNEVFERLGADVVVKIHGEQTKTKAIIQPMRYKNKLYIDMANTEIGLNDTECFLYLGSAEVDFTTSERYTSVYAMNTNRSYNVSRADRICIGDEILYIWAVLKPRIKGDRYDTM